MSLNPRLVKESFAVIEPVADKAAAYFYGRLFAENPHMRAMFPPAMDTQRDRLFGALTRIVWSLDSLDGLSSFLGELGRGHRRYGVLPEHYTTLGNALLATVRRFAAEVWSPEMEAAWLAAYTAAADIMITSAEEDARTSPAWWTAEVIGHELRAPDIAVITLRPDEPLPYLPGQHVDVQTARWPRVWRPFSIANAPRRDNTVRLHVRAVPGGWVSSALVGHTRIGDTVTLGAPGGTMTPPEPGRDILCVAGGTGLAPLKAIVEHVITSDPTPPRVRLLYGARTSRELYDLPDLMRMRSRVPRLEVVPVVSDEPRYGGERGRLPEVVDRLRPWAGHEVYVCGPDDMVEETILRLQRGGVPPADIHRDRPQEGRRRGAHCHT
ncbi:globin domain-containing protein [Streptosporangium sp. NPDC020145]|uniref:globin domain-containing protein n=1 Tax=Streptosporangium sp. NPDC020145 TaxID=3154694 RepID=UPI00343C59C2